MSQHSAEVIVVGAGLSGLTAAWRLGWAGCDLRVLEAAPQIGGRILTTLGKGAAFRELGAPGLDPRLPRLMQLIDELALTLEPLPARSLAALAQRRRETLGHLGLWRHTRLWRALEREAAGMPPDPAPGHVGALALDCLSLADWLARRRPTARLARELAEEVLWLFGVPATELSLLQAVLILRQHGGRQGLEAQRLGQGLQRPRGGMHELCTALAARLGEHLILEQPLLALRQDAEGVDLYCAAAHYRARQVVLALPVLQLQRLDWQPALPGWRDEALRHYLPQPRLDAWLDYERAFWRERLPKVPLPLRGDGICIDECLPGETQLQVVLLGERARRLLRELPARREARLLETLAALLGRPASEPLHCQLHAWAEQPWLRAAQSFCPPGGWLQQASALRRRWGRVHFAGADLAARLPATLEGAVEAGERAAEAVLAQG